MEFIMDQIYFKCFHPLYPPEINEEKKHQLLKVEMLLYHDLLGYNGPWIAFHNSVVHSKNFLKHVLRTKT